MIAEQFKKIGEYCAAGLYEEEDRSLFYRKALGLRRYYENCELPEYNGELLYPSGINKMSTKICPSYLEGTGIYYDDLAKEHKELADLYVSDFKKYTSSVPIEHAVAGSMWTHSFPNYERILKEGFLSYEERIKKANDKDFKEGLLHLISGIKTYINRCVDYLKSVNADKKLIAALQKSPLSPAENIYEAVVAWNMVLYLDTCDNLGCIASGLYPYWNGENIVDLLKNLYDNLDANNGYSMSLSTSEDNPLIIQCLEASKGKRRPMIELLVNENTSDEIWKKAFEVVRTNNAQPAFYNESLIKEGLKKRFPIIKDEDINQFCGGGCTEAMLAGLSNVGSVDAGINLPLILEQIIKEKLTVSKTFDEFYAYYIDEVRHIVDKVTTEISNSQRERAKYNPLPMRTLLVDDCIDNCLDFNNGGARYKWSIVNFAGMVNIIDSMLVIRDFVFNGNYLTAEELIEKLSINDEEFLTKAKNHKVCYGKNNEDANAFSNKISTEILSMLDDKKPFIGEGFLPASIQFMSQVDAGKRVGATPDGRKSGTPLCDSLGAIFGKDTDGPTSLLNSVASLDLNRMLGTPVLSFNIAPDFNDTILKGLILGYMKLGGIQMQITCTSAEILEDAYKNPENHKNLVVRVGGYSERFNNLSDALKKMVINRSIQSIH